MRRLCPEGGGLGRTCRDEPHLADATVVEPVDEGVFHLQRPAVATEHGVLPLRAPLVIGVVSAPRPNPKIPDWEMQLSGGAAAMNLVIAANAMGYGTNWITNWYAYDEEGRRLLGLAPHERVIGFVHIGTFHGTASERPRPDASKLYADFSGPFEG